jgi:hypothetical protein
MEAGYMSTVAGASIFSYFGIMMPLRCAAAHIFADFTHTGIFLLSSLSVSATSVPCLFLSDAKYGELLKLPMFKDKF